jgi:hypothetical protein
MTADEEALRSAEDTSRQELLEYLSPTSDPWRTGLQRHDLSRNQGFGYN